MIMQIFCDNCGSGGRLPLVLTLAQLTGKCDTCHHEDRNEYAYYFCSVSCFYTWTTTSPDGFPCKSCQSTGFAFGFEENGPCRNCWGEKVVTKVKAMPLAERATQHNGIKQ